MTPYRPSGRRIYSVKVPRDNGCWRGITTGTFDGATARRMQQMIDELGPKGARAWDVLELLHSRQLTMGDLYDRWLSVKRDVQKLKSSLGDVDLEPMVEKFLAAASCSEDTKNHYRVSLHRLIEKGQPFPAGRFTTASIQKTIDEVELTSGTKRKIAAAFRVFANWLIARGVLTVNPVDQVTLPKAAKPRVLCLDVPDCIRLAEAQPSPYKEFSALLAGTGIEVSVALNLRRRDVNTDKRTIRAAGTKTHARDRIVRVADWAWPFIEGMLGHLPDSRLFAGIPHRYAAGDVHRDAIKALSKTSRVFRDYTMRDARHSYAVRSIRAGVPPEVVAKQLGHANSTLVALVYGRFVPSDEEKDRWERIATAADETRREESKK